MLFLSEIAAGLGNEGRRRLERRLGVLLRHPHRKTETTRAVIAAIRRNFKMTDCDWLDVCLRKGDTISLSELTEPEQKQLECTPLIQIGDTYHLPGECVEAWKTEPMSLQSSPFLFQVLHRLSLAEKRAYLGWLRRHTEQSASSSAYPSLSVRLYFLIRQLRHVWIEVDDTTVLAGNGPWPLEVLLGELWQKPPFYWYHRGVLPFYQCLEELERDFFRRGKKLPSDLSVPLMKHIYHGLRTGLYCLVEEEQGYGQPVAAMLYRTQDIAISKTKIDEAHLQSLLFVDDQAKPVLSPHHPQEDTLF